MGARATLSPVAPKAAVVPAMQALGAVRPFAPEERKAAAPHEGGPGPGFSFFKLPIQAKLTVGQPGDALEVEADQTAERVMRMAEPAPPTPAPVGTLQRMCATCADEEEANGTRLQRKTEGGRVPETAAPAIVHEVLRSPGQPLDAATRAFMEPRFGYDFGGVRVHSDARAAESAAAVQARAYTVGQHVVLGSAATSPDSADGRRLVAHELTHVVQQAGAPARVGVQRQPVEQRTSPVIQRDPICNTPADETKPEGKAITDFKASLPAELTGPGVLAVQSYYPQIRKRPKGSSVQVHGFGTKACIRAWGISKMLEQIMDPRSISIFEHAPSAPGVDDRLAIISIVPAAAPRGQSPDAPAPPPEAAGAAAPANSGADTDSGPPKRVDLPSEIKVVWGGDPFTITYAFVKVDSFERIHFDITYTGTKWSGAYPGPNVSIPTTPRKAASLELNLIAGSERLEDAKLIGSRGNAARVDIDLRAETGGNHVLSIKDQVKEFLDPGAKEQMVEVYTPWNGQRRQQKDAGHAPQGGHLHAFSGERNYAHSSAGKDDDTIYIRDEKLVEQAETQTAYSEKIVTEQPEPPLRPRPGKAAATAGASVDDIWYSDLTLGGYYDKFRVTVQPTTDTSALFGITGMQGSQFVGGGGAPLKGSAAYHPSIVEAKGDKVTMDLHGGKDEQLTIVDSISKPTLGSGIHGSFAGFATDRHHTIRVAGADLGSPKTFDFNVYSNTLEASTKKASDDDLHAMVNAAATVAIPEQLALGDVKKEADRYESALFEMRRKAFKEGTVPQKLGTWYGALYLTISQARGEQDAGKPISPELQQMVALAARELGKEWAKDESSPDEAAKVQSLADQLADAAAKGAWPLALATWAITLRSFDDHLVKRQKEKDVKEYKRFTHQSFESLMKGKQRIEELQGKPGLIRLAAVFYLQPKPEYDLQRNSPTAIPLSVYYWREDKKWQMRDYTNPDRDPIDHEVADLGGTEPPKELFEQLDHKAEYPYGSIHWKIPGGASGSFQTTEKETTGEKVRKWLGRVAMAGAAIGLALTGAGALLDVAWLSSAGSVALFVSAGATAVAATSDIVVKAQQGTLRGIDVAIDVGQIVASLAGMADIPAGHFVNQVRRGAQLTGWAGRAADVALDWYIPIKSALIVGDTVTLLGVTADVLSQLQKIKSLPPGQQRGELLELMATLFLTAGMSLISIKGATKEILEGVPTIRARIVDEVPTAFIEGGAPAPGGRTRSGAPEEPGTARPEPAAPEPGGTGGSREPLPVRDTQTIAEETIEAEHLAAESFSHGGHDYKILKDGRIVRCSKTCTTIELMFGDLLKQNPHLAAAFDKVKALKGRGAARAVADFSERLERINEAKGMAMKQLEKEIDRFPKGTEAGDDLRFVRYERKGGGLPFDEWLNASRGGRSGGSEHQKIVEGIIKKYGPTTTKEASVAGRFADAYTPAQGGKKAIYHQVGDINLRGDPIARERRAIDDIRSTPEGRDGDIIFYPKDGSEPLVNPDRDPRFKGAWSTE